MFNKIPTVWVIVGAAVLVSALGNIRVFTQAYDLATAKGLLVAKETELRFLLNLGIKDTLSELVTFALIVSFNYSWKDKLIPRRLKQASRIALIVLGNVLLFAIIIYADFRAEVGISIKAFNDYSYYPRTYLIKHGAVIVISFIAPYLLLQREKVKQAEINLTRLQQEKSKAQLAALKEQISPHFFFNTLSTLSAIVRNENPEAGLQFIHDMSDTYRYTLTSGREHLVPLRDEIDFIQSYIDLLQKRFGDKLQAQIDVPTQLMEKQIPPMSLQLLVENAMQHNIITTSSPLKVEISIEGELICVKNNLQQREDVESFGIGLKNLQDRYQLLSDRSIIIDRTELNFLVKLPLL